MATPTITLLVYGTLKRGFWNHDRFCGNAIDIQPATTWGRLYQLPAGYPALEVPESSILAHGIADPLADAATLPPQDANCPPSGDPPSPQGFGGTGWDEIHGELITFPDPARDFPPIDRLEGFRVGQESLYQRVLVLARTPEMVVPAWLYVAGRCLIGSGEHLRKGIWE